VILALKQPGKKNLGVLEPGTVRATVISELGLPIRTDEYRGEKVDIFKFSEGYSKELKFLRAGLHLTADAFTFGLWEIFGIVLETAIRPRDISMEVRYDAYDRVSNLKVLSDDNILLAESPAKPPSIATPPIIPIVTAVLMPQPFTASPQRIAAIIPHGPNTSFISSGLDLTISYLRTFHPNLTILEREDLEPVTQELILQHSGRIEDSAIARIGGWKSADTLLIVRIEQTSADRLQTIAVRGGSMDSSVEIRLTDVETSLLLFRQTTSARVQIPPPSSAQIWPETLIDDARRESLRVAYTYSLAALTAAFGDNPLGLVPDMSFRSGGIRLLGLLHGGPGHNAGLQEGDRILEVGGTPYRSVTQRIRLPAKLLVERRNSREEVYVEARTLGK